MPTKESSDDGWLVTTATWVLPSKVGLATLAGAGLLFSVANDRAVALGYMVPIVLFMIVDAVVSYRSLRRRKLRVRPIRTVGTTASPLTFRVESEASRIPVSVALLPISTGSSPNALVPFPQAETSLTLEDEPRHPATATYVRSYAICSWLGFARASTWETRSTPTLSWAPAPRPLDGPVTAGSDDVGRIRAYVPGDRYSRVSWPLTARTGQLHVRSVGPADDEAVVVLDLDIAIALDPEVAGQETALFDRLTAVIQRAADVVGDLLEQGVPVRLITREIEDVLGEAHAALAHGHPDRRSTAPLAAWQGDGTLLFADRVINDRIVDALVIDDVDLIERLARADMGPPMLRPAGPHIMIDQDGLGTHS